MLQQSWVVGWKNIVHEAFVGDSSGYGCHNLAVGTTNGAGGRNVQLLMLSADGVVVHALAGFWHPDDLARELKLALKLNEIWRDRALSPSEKQRQFVWRQRAAVRFAPPSTAVRSGWQSFDAWAERNRLGREPRDTFLTRPGGTIRKDKKGRGILKPHHVLVHDRMASRPFVPYSSFDVAAFADYGKRHYDNNRKAGERGVQFTTSKRLSRERAADKRARAALAEKVRRGVVTVPKGIMR